MSTGNDQIWSPFKELRRRRVAGAEMKKISWSANCLMTSAVTSSSADEDSAESLNQQLQMKLSAKDDATSYWRSAEEAKRKEEATSYGEASCYCSSAGSYSAISRCYWTDEATMSSRNAKISRRKMRRSRRSVENQPVARFSRKIQQKRKRSSSRLESAAAKQLTTYEELRKAGCQLLSLFKMAKATVACKRKGRKYCSCVGTLQRSVAQLWKEDKIAFWSAEQSWKLSNGKIFQQRLYIRGNAN
ncbi:hypothetical protein F511_05299 [Dorcoceras hygrometricum]|uniref:Uncharacterized protein n=1 Tax=Dorcoceras hygrometricum TaxID=472368 RepID=A0A2Z7BRI6_9LAMI|nr:hypothetical protein F511_05299 [Dorcoceras hygrometricum]